VNVFGLPVDSGLGVASQRRMVGGCQLAVGGWQRAVGGHKGNLGALPASECFWVAGGWQVGGCPANGGWLAAGGWGHKGNLGALPANEGFLGCYWMGLGVASGG